MSSDENEFGSEDDDDYYNEQEINLYTQLYFGDNFEIQENFHVNQNNEIPSNQQRDKLQVSYSEIEQTTEINEVKNVHTNLVHKKKGNSVSSDSKENKSKSLSSDKKEFGSNKLQVSYSEIEQTAKINEVKNIHTNLVHKKKGNSVSSDSKENQSKSLSSDKKEFGSSKEEDIYHNTQRFFGNLHFNKNNKISRNKQTDKLEVSYPVNKQTVEINEVENMHINLVHEKGNSVRTNSKENFSEIATLKKLRKLNNAKGHKRKRNPSICSIDSISGREPLDNLYCQSDQTLDLIEEEISDKVHCDTSLRSFVNDNLEETENILSEIVNIKSKQKLQNKVDIESSDDEVRVLYRNQSVVEPVSVDVSSDDSIEIIKSVIKKPSKKAKTNEENIIKRRKKSVSKQASSVTSCESKSCGLDKPLEKTFFFRLGSEIISTEKKNITNKKISKSCIIYTRNRPLTKKTPSCPSWTPEMASFYDSDYSDEFSVEHIHRTQKINPKLWKICAEDYQGPVKKGKSRYFEERCTRCKNFGHNLNSCPRILHCVLCGAPNHKSFSCPERCCTYCGKKPTHKLCNLAFRSNICSECKQHGHVAAICPDLWRKFHVTTSGSVPVIPDKSKASLICRKDAYCYNCAKKGHYGHECRAGRSYGDQIEFKSHFCSVSTQIFNYSSEFPRKTNETIDLKDVYNDEVEVLPPSKKNKPNEKELDFTSYLPITKNQEHMFITRRASISKEVGKMKRSGFQSITLNKDEKKIIFKGSKKSVLVAKKVVSSLILKEPFEHKSLIKAFNKEHFKPLHREFDELTLVKGSPANVIVKKAKAFCGQKYTDPINEGTINVFEDNVLTRSLPKSLSFSFKNIKNLYLPVKLPYKKKYIRQAYNRALMKKFSQMKKNAIIDGVLSYFSGDFQSLFSEPEFLGKFQQLSCVADFQSKREGTDSVANILNGLKDILKLMKQSDSIDVESHRKFSPFYSRLSLPNIKDIYKYLVLANRCKEQQSLKEARKLQRIKNDRKKMMKQSNRENGS